MYNETKLTWFPKHTLKRFWITHLWKELMPTYTLILNYFESAFFSSHIFLSDLQKKMAKEHCPLFFKAEEWERK